VVRRPARRAGPPVSPSSLPTAPRLGGRLFVGLLLALAVSLLVRPGPPAAGASGLLPRVDPAEIEAELARPPQGDSPAALRERVQRLADAYAGLGRADLAEPERRALGERILVRMAEVGLRLRALGAEAPAGPSSRAERLGVGLRELLGDASGLAVLGLGGLVICFALGHLAGYRRGARQASYYGEADPRIRFVARNPSRFDPRLPAPRVSLEELRRRLDQGHPVLLQLGYEIEAGRRRRFLAAAARMQEALQATEGQTFSVWEDPRHPNRFYECLECRDGRALDRLTAMGGPLSELAADIEACRPASGWVVRRAWWGLRRPAVRGGGVGRPGE